MKNAMDKLLREALAAPGRDGAPPTACLDADTAAALAEGTLSSRDRHAAEAHIAGCARCQTMVAALARTLPPASPRVWWRRPAFVWLAPLTAVGAALVVWAAVPQREIASPAVQSPTGVRTAERRQPSEVPGPKAEAREQDLARSEPAPPKAPPPAAATPAEPTAALRAPAANDQRARSSQRDPELMRQRTLADNSAAAKAIAPPAAPAATAVGEPQQSVARAAPAPPPAPQPLPSTPLPTSSAGARAAAADAAAPQMLTESVSIAPSAARQSLMRRLASETVIVSPNPTNRWRIGTGGVVQHSGDGGTTWQTQTTGVSVSLVAGSSPSTTVCWLVGPGGTVVLTGDNGRSWQRIAFPTPVDLRSVRATDDKTASVVAADGRQFSTSDGGATWQAR